MTFEEAQLYQQTIGYVREAAIRVWEAREAVLCGIRYEVGYGFVYDLVLTFADTKPREIEIDWMGPLRFEA